MYQIWLAPLRETAPRTKRPVLALQFEFVFDVILQLYSGAISKDSMLRDG